MSQGTAVHYVCTHEEARKICFSHKQFWVSNCGCREGKGSCDKTRLDVCLIFRGDIGSSGSGLKEITLTDMISLLDLAEEQGLVTRPYRNDQDKSITDGICFCCDDCCGYFLEPEHEICDKGDFVEQTDLKSCNYCGDCVPVCHFGARKMINDELIINREKCYGCGLCIDTCIGKSIELTPRY
jgi:Na+-translocating ferredoxin:NAD+ oxidoreductase subunit B